MMIKEMIRIKKYNDEFKNHVKEINVFKPKNRYIRNYTEYGFDVMPFLNPDYSKQFSKLVSIQNKINNKLKRYNNFEYVEFIDVHSGIQISLKNKRSPLNMVDVFLEYDLSNEDNAIAKAIQDFINTDNDKDIKWANDFYTAGRRYGWG